MRTTLDTATQHASTDATSRRGSGRVGTMPPGPGPVGMLTAWLVLLFAIPATQVLGPLGEIGTPAMLAAGIGALAWMATRVVPSLPADHGGQPIRVAVYIYVWYGLATVAMAQMRPLTELETSGSIREVLALLLLSGVALLAADALPSLEHLRTLLRRLVALGAGLATLGILEFFTRMSLEPTIPGLTPNNATAALQGRSIYARVRGTATHAIEFSVVMASLLPLALYVAMESEPGTPRRRNAWLATALIAFSVPLTISRSGILCLMVGMLVLGLAWSWKRRIEAMIVGGVGVVLTWLFVPGLVGTLQSLFTWIDADPSVQARLERVPRIMALIRERPLFGRGLGTFSVEDYFLIDNQLYVTAIELGIVGAVLTGLLLLLGVAMALTSRYHPLATPETTHLGHAVAAAIASLSVSMVTFDALHYDILTGTLFLLLGVAGALWRLTRTPRMRPAAVADRDGAPPQTG